MNTVVTPWRVVASKAYPEMYAVEGVYLVADNLPIEDANLIAAAPKLLELAKLVCGSFGGGRIITFSDEDIAEFEAAIAKAEGRS